MPPIRDTHRALADAHRAEAARHVRRACEPVEAGEHIHALIARAAQRLGFPYSRTEDLWRQEARRIDSWELEVLRKFKRVKRSRRR